MIGVENSNLRVSVVVLCRCWWVARKRQGSKTWCSGGSGRLATARFSVFEFATRCITERRLGACGGDKARKVDAPEWDSEKNFDFAPNAGKFLGKWKR